ncbi:hypothetical protein Bca52824_038619 [Brassica carinata]|uniref:Uncharacterized protein n=1 Tax=Brassica carinata TaxID=52824 RepID=A0A8X7RPM8_BRACI|nr:hypothetical protein Bca52824_038619 [Brassica carinata]
MVKIFHHSRGKARPNTALKPTYPTADPRIEETNQSSTIDPRTTNMEEQKRRSQTEKPEKNADETDAIGATDSRKLSWRRRCIGITASQNRT